LVQLQSPFRKISMIAGWHILCLRYPNSEKW